MRIKKQTKYKMIMKKILFFAFAVLFLCGCSESQIEQSLKKYVIDHANGVDVKYRLISYEFIDTVTVKDMIDSLSSVLPIMESEPQLDDFIKKRNQEFEDFRKGENYEEKIMSGELKDASEWCTEIRIITEKADSLIENWDKVTKYSYDYNYLYWWYMKRAAEFYQFEYDLSSDINSSFHSVEKGKDKFKELNSILNSPKDSVCGYTVLHKYSINNPITSSKTNISNKVYFDSNMNYKNAIWQN